MQLVLPTVSSLAARDAAVKPLVCASTDADAQVRGYALAALQKVGTEEAKQALREFGIEPESAVKKTESRSSLAHH